jgi:ABC-type nitrate/sulfonate/bicarbonate transport system permease component
MSTAMQPETAVRPDQPTNPPVAESRSLSTWLERHRSGLLGFAGIVVVLVIWQVSTGTGLADPSFSSNPLHIAKAEVSLFRTGEIYPYLKASGLEMLWGLLIIIITGIPIGLIRGRSRVLHDLTEPWVNILYSTPYVIVIPILIFWSGIGDTSRIVVIVWAGVLPLVINVTTGVRNLDRDYIRVATVFCTPRLTFLRSVALPATLPYILAGVRLAIGRALVGAIVAELFLGNNGLGYYVQNSTTNSNIDGAMAGVVIIAVVALLLNWGVRLIERRFTHWAEAQ